MSEFGFTLKSLYRLEVDELWDIARLIKKDENHYFPKNKNILIGGVIIPFLREVSKAPKDADKDQVLRSSLVEVAKNLSIEGEDWDAASNAWLVRQIRQKWSEELRKRLENLDKDQLQLVLKHADENLKKRAQQMGISLIPAAGVVAGELSGFGYMSQPQLDLGPFLQRLG